MRSLALLVVVTQVIGLAHSDAQPPDSDRVVAAPVEAEDAALRERYDTDSRRICALDEAPQTIERTLPGCSAGAVRSDMRQLREYERNGAANDLRQNARTWIKESRASMDKCFEELVGRMLTLEALVDPGVNCESDQRAVDQAVENFHERYPNDSDRAAPRGDPRLTSNMLLTEIADARAALDLCVNGAKRARERVIAKRAEMVAARSVSELARIPLAHRIPQEQAKIDAAESACSLAVNAKREHRLAAVNTTSLEELARIPRKYRLREEQARIDVAEAEHAALIEKRRNDRRYMQPVLSAGVCKLA